MWRRSSQTFGLSGGTSLRGIAAELNGRAIPTAQGSKWSAVQVQRALDAV
ncbi:recombinase family protein [Methylobacterium sp. P31]